MSLVSAPSVRRQLLLPFFAYFLMLASTSFIAGGIVHIGLGENTAYYMALTVVGIVCFSVGNYLQEFVLGKNARSARLGPFLLTSFVLSIGIGMVTGGIQHFLDNPSYSAVLIPVGLMLSVTAFTWREGVRMGRKLPVLLGGTLGVAALLFGGLSSVARAISPAGEAGHAHGQVSAPAAAQVSPAAAEEPGSTTEMPVAEKTVPGVPVAGAAVSAADGTVKETPHEETADGHAEGEH